MSSVDDVEVLAARLPLASSWCQPQVHAEVADLDGLRIHLVGLHSRRTHGEGDATGSAAQVDQFPYARAYHELVERTAILDAIDARHGEYGLQGLEGESIGRCSSSSLFPQSPGGSEWVHSRSNGVAARGTWPDACRAAYYELVERQRVLCCWFGVTQPVSAGTVTGGNTDQLASLYAFEAYSFPEVEGSIAGTELQVAGVFAFPKLPQHPLTFGFGVGADYASAHDHALRECLQRLGFLWGEPIPENEPQFEASPAYHQELYLWPAMHRRLRSWLRGRHAGKVKISVQPGMIVRGYVDLTPRQLLGRVFVAKALAETELPLTFGRGNPVLREAEAQVGVHPIA